MHYLYYNIQNSGKELRLPVYENVEAGYDKIDRVSYIMIERGVPIGFL
jgi:hypothetical protein